MIAKRCPVCGGKPQYVHYCIVGSIPDDYEPNILFKRLECKECGASVSQLVMTCDQAIEYWNAINPETRKRYVLQKIGTEHCKEVEPVMEENE